MDNFRPLEIDRDLDSPNKNIFPITAEIDEKGLLFVGGCQLSDLAKRYGTPLYVLDEASIRASCQGYMQALKKHYPGDSLPLYASKANSSLAMSSLIASEGFGLDAVSEGELITALKGGVSSDRIVLHGNNKSARELQIAYENAVTIVIDNYHDIELLDNIIKPGMPSANLMLRLTPGIECHTHEYIKTGHLDSKFGFDPDQLEIVLKELKKFKWAKLNGLHAHIGSQIFELVPHKDLVNVLIDAMSLAREIGHQIKDLNVGGGLGVRYTSSDNPPSIEMWIKVISQEIQKACRLKNFELPRLLCEPGRSLVSSAGVTLYRVGSNKNIPGLRKYISVDGGMSDNPRPITYQSLYTACLVDRPLERNCEKVTIAGKHCESGDILLKDFSIPIPLSGEILGVFGTGAYNFSMSSNYNRIPRPATIIVNSRNSELVQRREMPEDLLRFDVLPDRFMAISSVSLK
tara:strand:+ start:1187 stop:2569 length:1383 start_codon:yes stop_codon:yes gene_type:complete